MSGHPVPELGAAIVEAEARIRPHLEPTPLVRSAALSRRLGRDVWLKLESLQPTGSFKVRGALNAVLSLGEAERRSGVVAASSGNHGAAVAWAAAVGGTGAVVVVPETAPAGKIEAIRRLGGDVRVHGPDCLDAERYARETARRRGAVYLSPYNDVRVVAGQGTAGLELARHPGGFDAVYVAVGGGGLVAGIAAALGSADVPAAVVGCSPARSPVMAESVRRGAIVELPPRPTLSDATAGGLEDGAVTFGLCRDLVDVWIDVPEDAVAAAVRSLAVEDRVVAEGAAGVALAAALAAPPAGSDGPIAVVVCGGNIAPATLAAILHPSV